MNNEIYVSIDVETDGPIPGLNSMLSLGAVAFDETGKEISRFSDNLKAHEGAKPNPETMVWWASQPEAWKEATANPRDPAQVMQEFSRWLLRLPGRPVAVAYPAGFDFTFVYWYLVAYTGKSPFGFQVIDIKTLAFSKLGFGFKETAKRNMPKEWFKGCGKHTHKAVDDAAEQGRLFFNIRDWKKND